MHQKMQTHLYVKSLFERMRICIEIMSNLDIYIVLSSIFDKFMDFQDYKIFSFSIEDIYMIAMYAVLPPRRSF
jgi:hypothetical protein